jgi:Zn-finger nucleic acid-binding protein
MIVNGSFPSPSLERVQSIQTSGSRRGTLLWASFPDGQHASYAGGMPTPVVPNEAQRIPCPRCGMRTEHFLVDDFGVDRCLSCGAIWFDAKELERVEGCARKAQILSDTRDGVHNTRHEIVRKKPLKCPRDGAVLVVKQHWDNPNVDLDACPTCNGVLLECGEIMDLATRTWRDRVRTWWRS